MLVCMRALCGKLFEFGLLCGRALRDFCDVHLLCVVSKLMPAALREPPFFKQGLRWEMNLGLNRLVL